MAQDPRANFRITGDASDYQRKLKAAQRHTDSFASSVEKGLRAGALAGAAAVTAATFAIVGLTREAAKNADALAKQADKLGIATEKLAALQLAGRLTGVENNKLTLGMQRMTRRIAEAAQGSGEAQGALRELGLEAGALSKLPLDEQFQAIAKAMAGVDSQSDKIRLGFKLFDSEGVDLIRTLDVMESKFPQIEQEARAFGIAISRIDAKQIELANDAVERARTATQGIGTSIALAIAPIREGLATSFADAAAEANGFRSEINATIEALVVGANFGANAIRGIVLALQGAKLAALSVQETAAGFGADDGPTGGPNPFRAIGFLARGGENDAEKATARIRDEIDATGRKIDELVGKFQDADTALASFREFQANALANATAAVGGGDLGPIARQDKERSGSLLEVLGTPDEIAKRLAAVQNALLTETEAIRAAEAERLEIVAQARALGLESETTLKETEVRIAEDAANKILAIERRTQDERRKLNEQTEQAIRSAKEQTASLAIGLLQALGANNRAFAIAAIVLEKALAIKRTLIANRVAAELAFASQLIPGDPTSLARAAAAKAAVLSQGVASAALIAATGAVQIASLGSGSTGAPLGTPTNPVYTNSNGSTSSETAARDRPGVVINVYGNVNGTGRDIIEGIRRELDEKDLVLFSRNSRQALELQP